VTGKTCGYCLLGVFQTPFSAWNLAVSSTHGTRDLAPNTGDQLQALVPIITALANNLKAQGRIDELEETEGAQHTPLAIGD